MTCAGPAVTILSPFAYPPRMTEAMQELNPYFNQISDLRGRCASLRGYL